MGQKPVKVEPQDGGTGNRKYCLSPAIGLWIKKDVPDGIRYTLHFVSEQIPDSNGVFQPFSVYIAMFPEYLTYESGTTLDALRWRWGQKLGRVLRTSPTADKQSVVLWVSGRQGPGAEPIEFRMSHWRIDRLPDGMYFFAHPNPVDQYYTHAMSRPEPYPTDHKFVPVGDPTFDNLACLFSRT